MPSYGDFAPAQRVTQSAISPCGHKMALIDGSGGAYNLYVGPLDGPLTQLTHYQDTSVRAISWHPDGNVIAFLADHDGDEMYQVHTIDITTAEVTQHTHYNDRHFSISAKAWSPDGKYLAFSGNYPDPTNTKIWLLDHHTNELEQLTTFTGQLSMTAWSSDSTLLGGLDYRSNTCCAPFIVDVATKKHSILPEQTPGICVVVEPLTLTTALVVCDYDRDVVGIGTMDVTSTTFTPDITPTWELNDSTLHVSNNTITTIVNEQGYGTLTVFDQTTGATLPAPQLPPGVVVSFSVNSDGTTALVTIDGPTSPANTHVVDLTHHTVRQVTHNTPRNAKVDELIAPTLETCTSFDGHTIPMFVYTPAGPGPHPVVVSIHGGPQAQELPKYQPFYQYLLSLGIGVVAPNIRGSSGYGKAYKELILARWGIDDLADFNTVRDHVESLDWVDNDRVGVYGRSYGGFATLTCVTRMPDRWAAGVDIVGPSNLVSFCQSVPPTWREFVKDWVGDWENEADDLYQRSPIAHISKLQAPLLVIQGGKDPRVVQAESDSIVEALRKQGSEVHYDLYPNEGHVFTREANEWQVYNNSTDFFVKHLLG